jgi:bla regulator protein blaR1
MIAAWMLYCAGIGMAFAIAGRAIEWALHLARRQTRWGWCLALAGTLVVPAAAWLAPQGFSSLPIPFPEAVGAEPVSVPGASASAGIPIAQPARAFSLRDLDALLQWGWALSSAALLLLFASAAIRLSVLRRRWRASLVDGRAVLVSVNVGPAVTGLWRPRIVVPDWALDLTARQRELMLAHEEEHLRAGDPHLLAWAALAVAVAPWNPALWWQLRRLRLAVEMDCDARVLGGAGHAAEYGELLLRVGRRRAAVALAAPALGEPTSFLERRIRRLAAGMPRRRWLGVGAGMAIAAAAVIAACETPRPVEPDQASAIAQRVRARVDSAMARADSAMAAHLRPVIRDNLERYYPDLLRQQSGPPEDVWFGHDGRLRVLQAVRTNGTPGKVTSERIAAVLPTYRPGNDGWSVVDRRALKGLVRENVRVIHVFLGAGGAKPVAVDQQPTLLSGPRPDYPDLLRHAGIHGRVMVEAVIDTNGRAVPASVRVTQSPHPGFDQAARTYVLQARFAPARLDGRAVRAVAQVPVDFTAK